MTNRAQVISAFVASYNNNSDFNAFKLFPLVAPDDVADVCIYTPITGSENRTYAESQSVKSLQIQIDFYSSDYSALQNIQIMLENQYNNKTELSGADETIIKSTIDGVAESYEDKYYRVRSELVILF